MAYTALEQMRRRNKKLFGTDVGPFAPPPLKRAGRQIDLKTAALRFLREDCEGLRFDAEKTAEEKRTGRYLGKSLRPNEIPFNMQMDLNRLCLERELEKFIDSGTAEDAYTVYYAYLEMFVGSGGRSQRMVEMLSEFESNASSLLMKHRDHYSHSVYVFALGLAIYETNSAFRQVFRQFYGFKEEEKHEAAAFFLEYWGLTALFHDIGYPFEIPFEQVVAYFEMQNRPRGKGSYLTFRGMRAMTGLGKASQRRLETLFGRQFRSLNELLAYGIALRLEEAYGVSEPYLLNIIENKPKHPERNGFFMDHAVFSAARLFGELCTVMGAEKLKAPHLDVLSAIVLHNSLFKFAVNFYKSDKKRKAPLAPDQHPLAWMLMLCDELQCWDRTAYGRNSRTELQPMAAKFIFPDGNIRATYIYDEEEAEKIHEYQKQYRAWAAGSKNTPPPRLKAYSDMAETEQRFLTDIEKIVDLPALGMDLTVLTKLQPADRSSKHTYLSVSNFLHMYDFAVALNARYRHLGAEDKVSPAQLMKEFDEMSLEYQLSNINQVQSFSSYLNAIGCFYTDKPVDFDMVHAFSSEETEIFAPLEHERWIREHRAAGWTGGDLYETVPLEDPSQRAALRERFRMHRLCMNGDPDHAAVKAHYDSLSEEEQGKDWKPFNSMLKLIKKFDGLRIYRLNHTDKR